MEPTGPSKLASRVIPKETILMCIFIPNEVLMTLISPALNLKPYYKIILKPRTLNATLPHHMDSCQN